MCTMTSLFVNFRFVGVFPLPSFIFKYSNSDTDIIPFPKIGFRFYVVHSYIEEEDVQVSIWPVCMDAHDSNYSVYTVIFLCSQHF